MFHILGIRSLREKPARTLLTILGIALGMGLYVAIATINASTLDSFRENIEAVSGKGKISISAGETGFDETILEKTAAVPGVQAAIPTIETRAYFEGAQEATDGLYILGVDLLQEQSVRKYKMTDEKTGEKVIEDPLVFLSQLDSIIITSDLAQKRNLRMGSKIRLATPVGIKSFTVRGKLSPEGPARAYGGSLAVMDIEAAKITFGKERKLDRIDIVPQNNVDLDSLRDRISKELGSSFQVERTEIQMDRADKMLVSYQSMLTFFSSLALVVGLFLVYNVSSVSVTERRKEIGTLRALGTTRTDILLLFASEGLFIGFLGSIIGLALGYLMAHYLVEQVASAVSSQLMTRVHVNRLHFTVFDAVQGLLFGIFCTLAASLLPAYRASCISPREAMKSATIESENIESRFQKLFSPLLGFALLFIMSLSMIFHWSRIWSPMETLNQLAAFAGTALIGPVLVAAMIKGMGVFFKKRETAVIKLARLNLLKSRKRTSSTVMALLIGLFFVMLIATVRSSFHHTLMTWIDGILSADLLVSSSGRMVVFEMQPLHENLADELLAIPGVRNPGAGRGIGQRIIHVRSGEDRFIIKATDRPPDWIQFKNIPAAQGENSQKLGKLLYESSEPAILVSETYFLKHREKPGELLALETPSGTVRFRIEGVIRDFSAPGGVFYMDRNLYKKLWKDPLVNVFQINLEDGAQLETVRAAIDRKFGREKNLMTLSNAEMRAQLQSAIDNTFAYTHAIELAALCVALMGLFNTLLMSILDRTREIGMLRAIGMNRFRVFRMILFESMLQGSFGAFIATVCGGFVGMMWVQYSLSDSLGMVVTFHFPWDWAFFTVLVGVMVSALAGVYPSIRAAKLQITDALSYE